MHAETLATSIVEAVLGPALDSVSNRERAPIGASPDQPPDVVLNATQAPQTPSTSTTPAAESPEAIVSAPDVAERVQIESTPSADRNSSDQSITPFNPIPNATPGAPRGGLPEAMGTRIMEAPAYIRRPLAFQENTPTARPDQGFAAVEGM